ncbi:MAG: hypothetical protein ACRD2O_00125 [Terriglobia bacterium]
MKRLVVLVLAAFLMATFGAPSSNAHRETITVRIVNRQSSAMQYSYIVPGSVRSDCSASAFGNTATGNCVSSGTSGAVGSYSVTGATFTLLLPDSRLVLVNCAPKTDWKPHMTNNLYRSCRKPLTDTVEVEFSGDKAKLEWSVSVDGKKKESETYKVIGIFAPGRR